MQLGYTIVYVQNVAATLDFYERAFHMTRRFISEEGDYGELVTGETTLSFASESLGADNGLEFVPNRPGESRAAGIEIALIAEDVQLAHDHAVAQGATSLVPPKVKPWGQTVAYVRDLNGVLIELCTRVTG